MLNNLNHIRKQSNAQSYISNEFETLEREEEEIDKEADRLEKRLRKVMEAGMLEYIFYFILLSHYFLRRKQA